MRSLILLIVVVGLAGVHIAAADPCVLTCPAGAFAENEPPLQNYAANDFNSGCLGHTGWDAFEQLGGDADGMLTLCGSGGWYLGPGDVHYRDSDWYIATFGDGGTITLEADAEEPLLVFELGPQDCSQVTVQQQVIAGPCAPAVMVVTGVPHTTVWLWTGAVTFTSPDGTTPYEFDYTVMLSGLEADVVAVQGRSWSTIKSIFAD